VDVRIVLAAALAINGGITAQPHHCLRFVRQVVEHAYGWPPMGFYERYWTHRVEENRSGEPWARDLERSLRNAGYQVATPQAGDLVFNHAVAWPYGHAGVMLSDVLVIDAWPNPRGPPLRVTPVWDWKPTTIIRLPDN
jgi:hypothetical protein